jgi:uncharacterized SAM-binding protein YcdF (DUF218 family)
MDTSILPVPQKKRSPYRKILFALITLALIWCLYVAGSIYAYAQVDGTAPADVAIVLGAGVRNEQPSGIFRARIDHAIDLFERGVVDAIIFTGGVGPGNQLAGSEAARQYAIEHGIPESLIYIETVSRDTYENLAEAKSLMEARGFKTALIVSDPLHMYRAMAIARDLDMNVNPSPTPSSRIDSVRAILNFMAREIVSVTVYFIFPAS